MTLGSSTTSFAPHRLIGPAGAIEIIGIGPQ